MPRIPLYVLIWSKRHSRYDLYTQGHLEQGFPPGDADAWLAWLETVTSFAFRGVCGSLNVYQEARRRAGRYWYAYATTSHRTRKRYLGRTTSVTFARLEEAATALWSESSPTPLAPEFTQDERDAASHQALPVTPCEVFHGMEVLSTKLSHPQLPFRLLARERLRRRLDAARFHRLTLLSATAGWGKTTLLSTWASRSSFPIAWLSLDELDNDPVRFWVSVLAALRTCLPGVGETALAMLRSPQPPSLTSILTTILNDLRAQDAPTVLLLDDYHLIDEPTIHDSMLFVLDHLPAHLHLVLSSRVDPELALSRWRARGQLLELRDADLRFQEEEAALFLTHTMGLPLEAEEVAQLARRTEGWIAGLQLAALSMQHRDDRSAFVRGFTGSHRYVLDYVQEEILARLQAPLRNFLLHTSILSRISASSCQVVTAQPGLQESEALLKQLERANLFLVSLDEERRWYRMHDLFREVLLACLHASQPEQIPLLHRRAARWYEGQGEFQEAMAHWLAARDFSCAVHLMKQVARQFWLHGKAATMSHWVMQLPDALLREHARLVLTSALYLLTSNFFSAATQWHKAYQEAQALMARVETALLQPEADVSRLSATEMRLLEQRLRLLRAWSDALEPLKKGEREQFRFLYQQMLDLERDEEVAWQMIPLSTTFIFSYAFQREGALLVPRLQDAWRRVSQSGDHFAMIQVRRWLAMTYLCAGRLCQAYQESLATLRLLEQVPGYAIWAGYCSILLVLVLYQWNRLQEARNLLQSVIHDVTAWQHVDVLVWSYRALVMVELAAAHQALQGDEHMANHVRNIFYHSWAVGVRVRCWLAMGQLAEADEWAARVVFHQDDWEPHRAEEFLALIRVYLARAEYVQAVQTLERFRSHLDRPADIAITIEFLSLYVVALRQAGIRAQARSVAIRLLTLTEPEGYIRVYLDAGEAMKHVLQSLLDAPQDEEHGASAVSRSYVLTLLEAFEQEASGRAGRAEGQHAQTQEVRPQRSPLRQSVSFASGLAASSSALVPFEPLSRQEQRVLRLLATGRSNLEIAGDLVVSINTVKAHIKKIYSKLHVDNRVAASEVAHQLHLL